jgi:hypothetical protein
LFGERSLRKALTQFQEHYHEERNSIQGKNHVLLFSAPAPLEPGRRRGIRGRERLGGLLRFYEKVVKVKADVAAILNFFSRSIPQIEADHLDAASVAPIGGMRKVSQSVHPACCLAQ